MVLLFSFLLLRGPYRISKKKKMLLLVASCCLLFSYSSYIIVVCVHIIPSHGKCITSQYYLRPYHLLFALPLIWHGPDDVCNSRAVLRTKRTGLYATIFAIAPSLCRILLNIYRCKLWRELRFWASESVSVLASASFFMVQVGWCTHIFPLILACSAMDCTVEFS